jgi:hypothetical protein
MNRRLVRDLSPDSVPLVKLKFYHFMFFNEATLEKIIYKLDLKNRLCERTKKQALIRSCRVADLNRNSWPI